MNSTGNTMTIRDAVTGAEIIAVHDTHHIVIEDDGVGVIYLTASGALALARQLLDSVTPADAINVIGQDPPFM